MRKDFNAINIPIYVDYKLNLVEMRRVMGITTKTFADLTNINISQIRKGEPTPAVKKKVVLLEKILLCLWEISKHEEKYITWWFSTPNPNYENNTPIEYMSRAKSNIKEVAEELRLLAFPEKKPIQSSEVTPEEMNGLNKEDNEDEYPSKGKQDLYDLYDQEKGLNR